MLNLLSWHSVQHYTSLHPRHLLHSTHHHHFSLFDIDFHSILLACPAKSVYHNLHFLSFVRYQYCIVSISQIRNIDSVELDAFHIFHGFLYHKFTVQVEKQRRYHTTLSYTPLHTYLFTDLTIPLNRRMLSPVKIYDNLLSISGTPAFSITSTNLSCFTLSNAFWLSTKHRYSFFLFFVFFLCFTFSISISIIDTEKVILFLLLFALLLLILSFTLLSR